MYKRQLKKKIPNARLVICGDGSMRKKWQQMAHSMDLDDVFFEGFIARDNLPAYYHRADVYVSPSVTNESFAITLLEAMAARTPVIATTNNGSNTLGEHGVTGLVIEPRDDIALAQAMEYLLEDRDTSERLGNAAQERAREFDWNVVARRILDYYDELSGVVAVDEALRASR